MSKMILKLLTKTVLYFELIGPFLLIFPFATKKVRDFAVILFILMHVGFGSCLDIGLFMIIPIAANFSFLTSNFWDIFLPKFILKFISPNYLLDYAKIDFFYLDDDQRSNSLAKFIFILLEKFSFLHKKFHFHWRISEEMSAFMKFHSTSMIMIGHRYQYKYLEKKDEEKIGGRRKVEIDEDGLVGSINGLVEGNFDQSSDHKIILSPFDIVKVIIESSPSLIIFSFLFYFQFFTSFFSKFCNKIFSLTPTATNHNTYSSPSSSNYIDDNHHNNNNNNNYDNNDDNDDNDNNIDNNEGNGEGNDVDGDGNVNGDFDLLPLPSRKMNFHSNANHVNIHKENDYQNLFDYSNDHIENTFNKNEENELPKTHLNNNKNNKNNKINNRIKKYIKKGIIISLIICSLYWNFAIHFHAETPDLLLSISEIIRIDQRWDMFAPDPPLFFGWFYVSIFISFSLFINLLTFIEIFTKYYFLTNYYYII